MILRDDVVFHDGTPFDAEAVKANLDHTRADMFEHNVRRVYPRLDVQLKQAGR